MTFRGKKLVVRPYTRKNDSRRVIPYAACPTANARSAQSEDNVNNTKKDDNVLSVTAVPSARTRMSNRSSFCALIYNGSDKSSQNAARA